MVRSSSSCNYKFSVQFLNGHWAVPVVSNGQVQTIGCDNDSGTVSLSHCCEQKCQSLHRRTKMRQQQGRCRCCPRGPRRCRHRKRAAATLCTVHRNWSLLTHTRPAVMITVRTSSRTALHSAVVRCQRPPRVSVATARCISSTHTIRHFSISAQIWARPCQTSKWCHRAMTFASQQDDRAAYMVIYAVYLSKSVSVDLVIYWKMRQFCGCFVLLSVSK